MRSARWPARACLTPTALRSHFGFVFDHASPIGEVIDRSPSHFRLQGALPRGRRARRDPPAGRTHARSWRRPARSPRCRPAGVDEQTTINVGAIARRRGDQRGARALLASRPRSAASTSSAPSSSSTEVVERIHDAAHLPDCDVDLDVSVEQTFAGYRQPPGARAIARGRGGAAPLRARAPADRQRRRLRRQRPDRGRSRTASTSPTAPQHTTSPGRASPTSAGRDARGRAGRCSRSRWRSSRGRALAWP